MPSYKYEALDTSGAEVKASIEATNEEEASQKIKAMGYGAFSLTDLLKNFKRVFIIIDILLSLIGSIALAVSSLGIVNTMATLEGADTATIGHKVGAALVGTFLGILVSYGFVGPIAAAMEHHANAETKAFEVVKMALVATVRGYVPAVAIEFSRKLLWTDIRPTFGDLEAELKGKAKPVAAPAAA